MNGNEISKGSEVTDLNSQLSQTASPEKMAEKTKKLGGEWQRNGEDSLEPAELDSPVEPGVIEALTLLFQGHEETVANQMNSDKVSYNEAVEAMRKLYNRSLLMQSKSLVQFDNLVERQRRLHVEKPQSELLLEQLNEQVRKGQSDLKEQTVRLMKAQKAVDGALDEWRDRTLIMTQEADAKWGTQLALQKLQQDNFNLELVGNIGLLKGVQTNGKLSFIAVGLISGLTSTALTLMMGAVAYAVVLN